MLSSLSIKYDNLKRLKTESPKLCNLISAILMSILDLSLSNLLAYTFKKIFLKIQDNIQLTPGN